MPAAANGLKFCPRCKQVKPVSEFSSDPNPHRRDGLQTYCKPCKVDQNRLLGDRRSILSRQPPADGFKSCVDCKESKPVYAFSMSRSSRDGLACRCRSCAKVRQAAWIARRKANGTLFAMTRKHDFCRKPLSPEQYAAMLLLQNGVCALCRKAETSTYKGRIRQFAIDHDHATGKVRGLLCSTCNIGIGHLQDSPALLEAAAAYLRAHGKA